jgi:type IV secretion system protein VirD4
VQHDRRTNPAPFPWELPVAAALAVALLAVVGVHLGHALAGWAAGAGWHLTPREHWFTTLPDTLTGGPAALAWVVGTELLLALALVRTGRAAWARWGPRRVKGMATRGQAERLLGATRLRTAAPVIRPDLPATRRLRDPRQVGWHLGRAREPRGGQLWVPWDRTGGVIGPQGSGKTLDLLLPALLDAPGAALVTLTKVDDLLLSLTRRQHAGRPVAVLDPFGLAVGLPELVWDPIDGCVDPMVAERRAKAFTAGTIKGSQSAGQGDDAARFYAAEAAKVIQAYFHAAALTGRDLDDVLAWVAHPLSTEEPAEILREHPHAAPFWAGLLTAALKGDDRTAGNTVTTVQQALALFFQEDIRSRCVPGPHRPGTDIAALLAAGGTVYLLGRDDPYASASPLMTALAEHVLDTALAAAHAAPHGRLCPPMLACLDELPSTAPLPTLRTRMANERALGISFIYATQTWPQLAAIVGEHEARSLLGLTNVLVLFGGSKDVAFNQQISDMLGPVRVRRTTWSLGRMRGVSTSGEDIPILTGAEVRQLPDRQALVVAEHGKPVIAALHRCIDGPDGQRLLAEQAAARAHLGHARAARVDPRARATAAHAEARRRGLTKDGGW